MLRRLISIWLFLVSPTVYAQNFYQTNSNSPLPIQRMQSQDMVNDIECIEGHFFSLSYTGSIDEWSISNGMITNVHQLFASSPLLSLSYNNALNPSAISKTFYGNDNSMFFHYYDGTSWISLPPATYVNASVIANAGGVDSDLYFMGTSPTSTFLDQIYRYDGDSLHLISQLPQGTTFAAADLAVDNAGNIWTLTGTNNFVADFVTEFDRNGNTINSFPLGLNNDNAYGMFISDGYIYVGLGGANLLQPYTLAQIQITGGIASVVSYLPFPNSDMYDLAGCKPEGSISQDVHNQTRQPVKIYPNPFLQNLFIDLPEESRFPIEINLTDNIGHIIIAGNIFSHEMKIPVNLSAGIYYLNIPALSLHQRLYKIQ